ncbi:MAG TPA: hypothetical protein VMF32_11145 [Xanthobacteraceae bacterium]|nr:hypothetical protein [Xanthobacteraceae bacterium]
MRATIAHREEVAGFLRAKRHYYVDCQVLFSEEEKAIIKTRGLANHTFTVDPAVPPPARTEYVGAKVLRGVAPLVLLTSCVGGIVVGHGLGTLLFLLASGMFGVSFILRRKTDFAELPNQVVSLKQLLDDPRFTIYAPDPSRAKALDDGLRATTLAAVRNLLIDSTEVRNTETFEL